MSPESSLDVIRRTERHRGLDRGGGVVAAQVGHQEAAAGGHPHLQYITVQYSTVQYSTVQYSSDLHTVYYEVTHTTGSASYISSFTGAHLGPDCRDEEVTAIPESSRKFILSSYLAVFQCQLALTESFQNFHSS